MIGFYRRYPIYKRLEGRKNRESLELKTEAFYNSFNGL